MKAKNSSLRCIMLPNIVLNIYCLIWFKFAFFFYIVWSSSSLNKICFIILWDGLRLRCQRGAPLKFGMACWDTIRKFIGLVKLVSIFSRAGGLMFGSVQLAKKIKKKVFTCIWRQAGWPAKTNELVCTEPWSYQHVRPINWYMIQSVAMTGCVRLNMT